MRKSGLLVKINIYILSSVLVIFIITNFVIGYNTSKNAYKRAERIAMLEAQKVAYEVKNHIDHALQSTNIIAQTLEVVTDNGNSSRELVLKMLKKVLSENDAYYAVWTMWEPNAFDGKDSIYAKFNNQKSGVFFGSYFRSGDELLKQNYGKNNLPVYFSSDAVWEYKESFYNQPKVSKKQYVSDPSLYTYTGAKKDAHLLTSVVTPLIKSNQVLGVVGIDLEFKTLMKLNSKTNLYESGFSAIISNNNIITAHPNNKYVACLIDTVFRNYNNELGQCIKKGKPYLDQTVSEYTNMKVLRIFTPIEIGNSETPWSVMVEVPIKEINAETRNILFKLFIIALSSLIILGVVIYFIVKNITTPIIKGVQLARKISDGKLEDSVQISTSNDELGDLSKAFGFLVQKLKLIHQVSEIGFWELDVINNKMKWSDGLFNLLEIDANQYSPSYDLLLDRVYPDDVEVFKTIFVQDSGRQFVNNKRFRIKLNPRLVKYVIVRFHITKDNSGRILYNTGVVQDVTDLVKKEIKLKESEEKFRRIFNTSNDAILIVDMKGEFIDANKIAFERCGLSREELFKLNYKDYVINNYQDKNQEYKLSLFSENEGCIESAYINAKGKRIFVEIRGTIMCHKGEKVYLFISRDITERKELENKIIQAIIQTEEKERSYMAKELHDGVSPVLSTIKLYSNALSDSNSDNFRKRVTKRLNSAIDEAIRGIYEISNNLTPHILENFGLVIALQSFIEKIEDTMNIKFNFVSELTNCLPNTIEVNLYRVVIELINNTIKHARATEINIIIKLNTDIKLVYIDNGVGFDMSSIHKREKGMGLFNISNRIKSLNGWVKIESKPNKGMKLEVTIPNEE